MFIRLAGRLLQCGEGGWAGADAGGLLSGVGGGRGGRGVHGCGGGVVLIIFPFRVFTITIHQPCSYLR